MTSDSNIYKKDMQIIIITYYVIFMVYLNANFINIDDVIKRVNYKYASCISLYKMLIKYPTSLRYSFNKFLTLDSISRNTGVDNALTSNVIHELIR